MNRLFLLIIVIETISIIHIQAQSTQQNLDKYWYYRQRLRDYFVVVDPNDGFGTNIPYKLEKDLTVSGGDGNSHLQHYIGVLATEYRLLADNGQATEAANTKNE